MTLNEDMSIASIQEISFKVNRGTRYPRKLPIHLIADFDCPCKSIRSQPLFDFVLMETLSFCGLPSAEFIRP
jgi:hypothetical protein